MSSCIDGLNCHPQNVHEAAIVLDLVKARLLELKDPRAAFTDIYGIVTRAVASEVRNPNGMFLEPSWLARLAGRFCERYLTTLSWSEHGEAQDCGAWHVAYACAACPLTPPIQNALLGFNAHINYDLAFGIHATVVELGIQGSPTLLARFKRDHDHVNTILRRAVREALDRLAQRHGCSVSGFLSKNAPDLTAAAAMTLLTRWREHVWSDVTLLLAAPTAAERAVLSREIERRSFRLAQLLALPNLKLFPAPERHAEVWPV